MHQYRPPGDLLPDQPKTWQERLVRSRYLIGALLLHIILFVLLATLVVWPASTPPSAEFEGVSVKVPQPPPPPPQAASAGDNALNPHLDPEAVVVPTVTPPSVLTTTTATTFTLDKSVINAALSHLNETPQGSGLSSGGGNTGTGAGNGLFGSFTGGNNELQGQVYDLKIDPNHKATGMNQDTYNNLLRSFIAKGWDESVFSSYYKASKKLFTPAIWIPTTPSQDCADKMRLDKELSPAFWVGWYHAKVTPAAAGKYHFIGFGDDILVVAINGQTVFDGSLLQVTPTQQTMPWPYQDWCVSNPYRDANYAKLRVGKSFEVNGVEPVTIDILMGDEPGFFYCAYLLVADESKEYPVGFQGVPLYPIFQIGTDPVHRSGDQPPHASEPVSWAMP